MVRKVDYHLVLGKIGGNCRIPLKITTATDIVCRFQYRTRGASCTTGRQNKRILASLQNLELSIDHNTIQKASLTCSYT